MPLAVSVHHPGALDWRGCLRKRKYLSLARAQEALIALSAYVEASPEHPLNVYRCDRCAFFHIGHRPTDARGNPTIHDNGRAPVL